MAAPAWFSNKWNTARVEDANNYISALNITDKEIKS